METKTTNLETAKQEEEDTLLMKFFGLENIMTMECGHFFFMTKKRFSFEEIKYQHSQTKKIN